MASLAATDDVLARRRSPSSGVAGQALSPITSQSHQHQQHPVTNGSNKHVTSPAVTLSAASSSLAVAPGNGLAPRRSSTPTKQPNAIATSGTPAVTSSADVAVAASKVKVNGTTAAERRAMMRGAQHQNGSSSANSGSGSGSAATSSSAVAVATPLTNGYTSPLSGNESDTSSMGGANGLDQSQSSSTYDWYLRSVQMSPSAAATTAATAASNKTPPVPTPTSATVVATGEWSQGAPVTSRQKLSRQTPTPPFSTAISNNNNNDRPIRYERSTSATSSSEKLRRQYVPQPYGMAAAAHGQVHVHQSTSTTLPPTPESDTPLTFDPSPFNKVKDRGGEGTNFYRKQKQKRSSSRRGTTDNGSNGNNGVTGHDLGTADAATGSSSARLRSEHRRRRRPHSAQSSSSSTSLSSTEHRTHNPPTSPDSKYN
jgi:hypothetical protein